MDLAVINQRIGVIRRGTKSRREYIQATLVGIVEHAREHGDCTAAAKLVRAVEKPIRSQLTKWFTAVSPINVTMGKTATEDKARFRKDDQKDYTPFNIDRARTLLYWEMESDEARPAKVFNHTSFREDIQAVLGRYQKKLEGMNEADRLAITQDMQRLHQAIADNGQREATPALREQPLVEVPGMEQANAA